jgi:hypothetical protein
MDTEAAAAPAPSPSFIDPETITCPISGGRWIKIKKYLNIFDQRRAESAGVIYAKVEETDDQGNKIKTIVDRVDWSMYEIARAEIWLVKWHMPDSQGEPRELNIDSIKALNPEIFDEISHAIFKRVTEIAEEKKRKRMAIQKEPEPAAAATSS